MAEAEEPRVEAPEGLQRFVRDDERFLWLEERKVRHGQSLLFTIALVLLALVLAQSGLPTFALGDGIPWGFIGVLVALTLGSWWIEKRDRSWAVTDKRVIYWLNKRRTAPTSIDLEAVRIRGRGPPVEPLQITAPMGPIGVTFRPRVRDPEGMLRALREAGVRDEPA